MDNDEEPKISSQDILNNTNQLSNKHEALRLNIIISYLIDWSSNYYSLTELKNLPY